MIRKNDYLIWGIVGIVLLAVVALIFSFFINGDESLTGRVVLEEAREITPVICSVDYRPVCGKNEETYSNLCVMEFIGAELLHVGECGASVDSIYFGGSIITMKGDEAEYVEAVSVKDGNVVFVGSLIGAAQRQGVDTVMRDLGRNTMLPDHILVGGLETDDIAAMTKEMRGWTSYGDVRGSIDSVIDFGRSADFIIIDLDLIIEERMNISSANILESIKEGETLYISSGD